MRRADASSRSRCSACRRCAPTCRAAEAAVGVRLEGLLPEEVHIIQHFPAAHKDESEILNDVGIGIPRVYPLDSQYLVNQSRLTGRTELADDVKNSAKAVDLFV